MNQQLERRAPTETKTAIPRGRLSLDDLGHDPDRDRTTHLFLAGYDRSVPQRARCGTLIHPPFRPHGQDLHPLCVVCVDVVCRRNGARRITSGPDGSLWLWYSDDEDDVE
jgi:hypothetical protein